MKSWQKKTLLLGLILVIGTLLASCVTQQKKCVKTIPDYQPEFYECIADEYEKNIHGRCTKGAINDWTVIIGL